MSPRRFFLASSPALLLALAACSAGVAAPSPGEDVPPADSRAATGTVTPGVPAEPPAPGTAGAFSAEHPTTFRPTGVVLDHANVLRDPATSIDPATLASAVAANNAFAFDLYAHVVAAQAAPGNLVTSPLGASFALTMAYAGAQGQTATEMATALHYGDAAATIFDGQNALAETLASRPVDALSAARDNAQQTHHPAPDASDYQLELVSSVWGEQTYPWAQPFLVTLAKSYGTGVYLRDFVHAPEEARLTIDGWVSQETDGRVDGLLPPGAVDDATRVVLVDALHVRMPWASPFDPSRTAPASFTRGDGSAVSASFMNAPQQILSYADDGKAQLVALPLAGGDLSVVFALPHGDLASYEAGLSALAVPAGEAEVVLSVPKFAFGSPSLSLASALQAMGMKRAFDPSAAELQGMCATTPDGANLHVGDVLQKTTIAVQETGVEAAAATAATEPGIVQPDPVTLTLDRPFSVAIVDATGAVLFLGHVEDPTATAGE